MTEANSEFSIIEKLGVEKLRLLLDIAAELSGYTAGEAVSVGDLAFDERVTEQEIGRSRVRDALALFQRLDLITLDDDARMLQPSPRLIDWAHGEVGERTQQLIALLQPAAPPSEISESSESSEGSEADRAETPPASSQPSAEPPSPRIGPARFGRGAGRQPIRVQANARSDEELLAGLEPASAPSPALDTQPVQAEKRPGTAVPLSLAVRRPASASQTQEPGSPEGRRWGSSGHGNGYGSGHSNGHGVTPNAAVVRRSALPAENHAEPSAVVQVQPPPTDGIVNLPTFFRLLDELNKQAAKLQLAGLTDDPTIKIDLLQLIRKIQE